MSNGQRKPGQADDLDRYLGGDSPVSRKYAEMGSEGPPPELDAKILAEAERVAKTRFFPTLAQGKRWMAPVALAATVVLSFSIVMSIVLETPILFNDEPYMPESRLNEAGRAGKDRADAPERAEPLVEAFGEIAEEVDKSHTLGMAADADSDMKLEQKTAPAAAQPAKRTMFETEPPTAGLPRSATGSVTRNRDAVVAVLREHLKLDREAAPSEPENLAVDEADPDRGSEEITEIRVTARIADQDLSPDRRLEEILQLYEGNKNEAAAVELANFRKKFPDHPVSMELLERGF